MQTPLSDSGTAVVTCGLVGAEQGDRSEQAVVSVADICSDRPGHGDTQTHRHLIMLFYCVFNMGLSFIGLI